jgi:small subunit ribosomal protein S8
MSDTIANMLTVIRNANRAELPGVQVSHSKMREGIARILKSEGYISDFAIEGEKLKKLKLKLKYEGRKGVITNLRRISRPGLRRYVGATEIPRVLGGMGISILSTPRGLMTGTDARKNNLGGELLCYVW